MPDEEEDAVDEGVLVLAVLAVLVFALVLVLVLVSVGGAALRGSWCNARACATLARGTVRLTWAASPMGWVVGPLELDGCSWYDRRCPGAGLLVTAASFSLVTAGFALDKDCLSVILPPLAAAAHLVEENEDVTIRLKSPSFNS